MSKYSAVGSIVLRICEVLGVISFSAVVIFVVAALFAWFTMLLVNFLFTPIGIAAVFGTVKLTFWKALCLNLLAGFLIKSTTVSKK